MLDIEFDRLETNLAVKNKSYYDILSEESFYFVVNYCYYFVVALVEQKVMRVNINTKIYKQLALMSLYQLTRWFDK